MNNKGFTLVELTAIIVVLAAIFLVSFPNILNMDKTTQQDEYDAMVEDLCLAGESYIYTNMNKFEELIYPDNKINISVGDLIYYGFVSGSLKNPNTETSIKNDLLIYTVLSESKLSCKYQEKDNN